MYGGQRAAFGGSVPAFYLVLEAGGSLVIFFFAAVCVHELLGD